MNCVARVASFFPEYFITKIFLVPVKKKNTSLDISTPWPLLVDIMESTMNDLIGLAKQVMDVESDPKAQLGAAIRMHVSYHAQRRKENFITDSEIRSLDEDARAKIVSLRDRYSAMFRKSLVAGQKAGTFRTADPSVVLAALFGTISSLPTWYKPSGRLSLDAIADEIANMFFVGIDI